MNNSQEERQNDEFLLTFADLLLIIKRNKKKIAASALFFALLALCYGLTKPVEYEAEATFKEKNKSQSGLSNSLSAAFFMMSDNYESNALTLMRSRRLIEDLVKEQKLQGIIVKSEFKFPLIPIQTIKNNLLTEYANLKKISTPILSDPDAGIKFQEVAYNDEIPLSLYLKVLSPEKFTIYDQKNKTSDEGNFGKRFSKERYSFTIAPTQSIPNIDDEYILVLLPLESTAQMLSKQFTIEPDRNDKSLLKISYKHRDRQQAAANVNALMTIYQKYIQCEHEQICEGQVNYLSQRQKEMGKVLENMMQAHADHLSSDLSSTGFATSEKAMEFLANTQHQLKNKLFTINLEIQRLQRAKDETMFDNDVFLSLSNQETINHIAIERRQLKQQADSLNLVLRNTSDQSQKFKDSFNSQLEDLETVKQSLKESHLALASLKKNEIPSNYPKLEDSKYIFTAWHERLTKAKDDLNSNPNSKECKHNWMQCKEGFTSYLSHLNHYLNVYQRNIEERLVHQQAPLNEFQGINLNIARELYVAYNKDLSNVESQATQHEFVINQLNEPDFEISSLSTILHDPLSLEMITKTSALILALKDQDNRSTKEQERLNFDLAIQKGFLKTHIKQSIALLDLRQTFLKEKIQHLQSVNLSLIQEQISILENQIKEYVSSVLENLRQEQELIETNLGELRMEMSAFPQKWAAEQLINQQMEINRSLVEEISKLVESKNISNNLEKLQSAPVDIAIAPLHPKSPRILLLTIIGAFAGAFLSFVWVLGKSVVNGVQASSAALTAVGQYVCGSLSRSYYESFDKDPILDNDLSTLRRLIAFMGSPNKTANTLLLLEGKGPNYSAPLAELLSRKGLKTLVIDLSFEKIQSSNSSGILQYLEGTIQAPALSHLQGYDKIETGGICRYANELICSQKFKDLLASLSNQYDWTIISSSASPKSAEAESLLDIFPLAVVNVHDETMQDLRKFIFPQSKMSKIAFIMTSQE